MAAEAHLSEAFAEPEHQAEAAQAGMWVFLASEMLFFGGLLLVWLFFRTEFPAGTAAAARHTRLLLGTVNTGILLCSSLCFAFAPGLAKVGRGRAVAGLCVLTAALGAAFLGLKLLEWSLDIGDGLLPGHSPGLEGSPPGADQFITFYFVATGLHVLHLAVGVLLMLGTAARALLGTFSAAYFSPVEVVGLYWSFVDMVWLVLFPVLYLSGYGP